LKNPKLFKNKSPIKTMQHRIKIGKRYTEMIAEMRPFYPECTREKTLITKVVDEWLKAVEDKVIDIEKVPHLRWDKSIACRKRITLTDEQERKLSALASTGNFPTYCIASAINFAYDKILYKKEQQLLEDEETQLINWLKEEAT
jgi:hypothetical protein